MKRGFWLVMMLIGGGLMLSMAWRGRRVENDAATLIVSVSGNTQGYLEPCGCQIGQSGGLARRQTLLLQQKSGLLIDTGSVFGGTGTYERLRGAYLLRGMKQMNYAAVNLGETEVALPSAAFSESARRSGIAFVSCNATANGKADLPVMPFRIETRGNLRVGITGIVDAADSTLGKGWTVKPPLEALAEMLPLLRAQCDVLIVLASAPSEMLTTLAERFPEIDAIFGSTRDGATGSSQVNGTTVFTTGIKGTTFGRLTFAKQSDSSRFVVTSPQILPILDTVLPDPKIAALIAEFHTELRACHLDAATEDGMERVETQTRKRQ